MNVKKNSKGITLIALVITIVVLLILTGVTIATLTGGNGIITRTNQAKEETEKAGAKEKVQMEVAGSFDEYGKFDMDKLKENLKDNLELKDNDIKCTPNGSILVTVDGYEILINLDGNIKNATTIPPTTAVKEEMIYIDLSSNNKEAYIPKEFKVSKEATEQKIDTGLVVIAPDGSEFVWVPVDKKTLRVDGVANKEVAEIASETNYRGVLYTFSGTTSTKIEYSNNGHREPDIVTDYDGETEYLTTMNNILETNFTEADDFKRYMQGEYNAIIGSIKSKGGFYIGRYESSLSNSTKTEEAITGNIQSKRNVIPTGADNLGTYMWYGLYAKQHEYATVINETYQTNIKSAMIYGSMYDAVMNWALYGTDKTDASKVTTNSIKRDSKQATGTLETDKIKNIYDLGNNMFEWTAEVNSTENRLSRGRSLYF